MTKVEYDGTIFDSQLEVDYYVHLQSLIKNSFIKIFIYHPKSIQLANGSKYTPDFLVVYNDHYEIIETKGYNQFSYQRDLLVHNLMLQKSKEELLEYCNDCLKGFRNPNLNDVTYRKIKYLKGYGWVDYSFKKPNTLANKRKEKISELENENKSLKAKIKYYERFFDYSRKEKLSRDQKTWFEKFIVENQLYNLTYKER